MHYLLSLDYNILKELHAFAVSTHGSLNLLMKIISLLANKGISIFVLAIIFICFKKTRKAGICMFGAVTYGTLIGNGLIKLIINRPRPFISCYAEIYSWWEFAGASIKYSSSFPSGHVMAVSAGFFSLYFIYHKKIFILISIILSIIMGISRCYLMVHYFSDVIAGFTLGFLSAYFSYWTTIFIYKNAFRNNLLSKLLNEE